MAFNLLRLVLGILLLPLLLRFLSRSDLGMYYLFLNLNAVVIVLDLGFSPTIGRFVSYAMGGAVKLTAEGLGDGSVLGTPNYSLLWELLVTARIFYRWVAAATMLLLGSFGSYMVARGASTTSSPSLTWLAWGVSVLAVAAETYFNSWNTFLRSMNRVLAATQISMLAYGLRLVLASAMLVCGFGLLSLPAASLITSFVIRNLSKRDCLRALDGFRSTSNVNWRSHFEVLWPNCWRLGLYFAGGYLSTSANVILCSTVFGLETNAQYGLSLQVANIISGVAAVWTWVKWPLVGQLIARQDLATLRAVFWPRLWLQLGTYCCLAVAALGTGPNLVHFFGRDKEMLPLLWLILLVTNGVFEAHCTAWNTLISLWNKLPMLWPTLATNAAALGLNVVLVHLPKAHAGLLVLGPLAAGLAFNYWFWPGYGARSLKLSWVQFLRYGLIKKPSPG